MSDQPIRDEMDDKNETKENIYVRDEIVIGQ